MFYRLPASCQIKVLDILYHEIFGLEKDGTFVEIGAYDGESFSNTSVLADLGWAGLYVEPVPAYAARCRARHCRNRVSVLNVAVAREKGHLRLQVAEGDTTAYPDAGGPTNADTIDVPAITPDELATHLPSDTIDVLVLDCEGGEAEILAAMDLRETWRPRMIILESRALNPRFDAETRRASQVQLTRLADAGWQVLWHDAINAVLLRADVSTALGIDYERAGTIHLNAGRPEAATTAFEQAVDLNPRNGRAWAGLAAARHRAGAHEDADAARTAARQLDAPRYLQHAAKVALHIDQMADARPLVAIAELLAEDDPDTALAAARLALADRDPGTAAARLQHALGLDPDRADVYAALVEVHRALGSHQEAIAAAERAYRLNPTAKATQSLAQAYLAGDAPGNAVALLERAVAARPENAHHHHTLSRAYERQGDGERARTAALAAARAGARDPNLWLRCARLMHAADSRRDILLEAVEACPTSAELRLACIRELETAGRWAEAYATLIEGVRRACAQPGLADALDRLAAPPAPDRQTDGRT